MSLYFKQLIMLLCLLLAACTEPRMQTLRIGTNVWTGYEPLYLARELDYLKKGEVDLLEYASASQVLNAYKNGLLDAAAVTLDEAIKLLEGGEDIRVILAMDVSNGADALLGQASLKSIDDLKGKRIGVEHNALGAYFIHRVIELSEIEKQDITIVPLEVHQHERASNEKDIDVIVTFDPVRNTIIQMGGNVLFDSSQISGEIVDADVMFNKITK